MPPDDVLPELMARYQGGEEEAFVEIGRLTGASAGVVRVRLHRARQKLKVLLTPTE